MTVESGSKDSAPFLHFGGSCLPDRGNTPKGTIGNNLIEHDVWFDQDEEVDFGFQEEEDWRSAGGELPPEEPF